MAHLGGSAMFLGDDVGFGRRESMADFGRVLSEYVDVIVVRANKHETAVELAQLLLLLGDQRADRLRPSLPGAGRPVHDPRVGRPAGRATRWPGSATATTSPAAWRWAAASWACGSSWPRRTSYRFDERLLRPACGGEVPELELTGDRRPGGSRARRGGRLHRRLDEHGPGGRSRDAAAATSPTYQVNAAVDVARARRGPSSCTACPPTAAKKSPTR